VVGVGIDAALCLDLVETQVVDACLAESAASTSAAFRLFLRFSDEPSKLGFGLLLADCSESGKELDTRDGLADDSVSGSINGDAGGS